MSDDLDDAALEARLYTHSDNHQILRLAQAQPDWAWVSQEKKRRGVTLKLLWQEYHAQHPEGYRYTSYTTGYHTWKRDLDVTLRQDHTAGEKLFVDYAGMTLPITDPSSGALREAQVFVAVLGASNYTYCEATWTQSVKDWLGSHRRALEFLGGVPQLIVPDNLKSGVKSASFYEPEINPSYAEFAQHYGVAVLPARVRKPRDKAKVEVGVQIVEREVLAPLRNRVFFELHEANEALWEQLEQLNTRPFQKLEGHRRQLFEAVDLPALRPLPLEPFVLAQWKKVRVNIDYHVESDRHYYSVPYTHAGQQVEVRLTENTLEVFLEGARIASHARKPDLPRYRGRHTTVPDHMPGAHQRHLEWTPERLIGWAHKIGEKTAHLVQTILESRPHPEQGYRSCLGLMLGAGLCP